MDKVTLKTLITSPMKVVRNYNRLVEHFNLSDHIIGQYQMDNEMLQTELDNLHLSHDWYTKYEGAQSTIKNLQDVLTSRNNQIAELEKKLEGQKRHLRTMQEAAAKRKEMEKPMPINRADKSYVRKLQEQLAKKCERIEELKMKVAQLEGDIITLTLNKE